MGADSYALTLWAFLHSQDAQHLASLVAEKEQIELAEKVALGFHDPKKIAGLWVTWKAKIGGLETSADVMRRSLELLERSERQRKNIPPS